MFVGAIPRRLASARLLISPMRDAVSTSVVSNKEHSFAMTDDWLRAGEQGVSCPPTNAQPEIMDIHIDDKKQNRMEQEASNQALQPSRQKTGD